MNNSQFKLTIRHVISYGRFYNLLVASECITLHQWAQINNEPNSNLRQKFYYIKDRMLLEKWERPEYQYNTQLKLTYRNSSMPNFVEVPNQD